MRRRERSVGWGPASPLQGTCESWVDDSRLIRPSCRDLETFRLVGLITGIIVKLESLAWSWHEQSNLLNYSFLW